MSVNVFVLGRPGSGKTTAVRFMQAAAHRAHYATLRVKDYDILRTMYEEDLKLQTGNFRPAPCDGFDIVNYAVLDEALCKLEEQVSAARSEECQLITIEFARSDYSQALNIFGKEFLANSYFLFLHAQLDTCKKRILQRVTHPPRPDYHFVSDYIMDTYYNQENWDYIQNVFSRQPEYKERVRLYENSGELADLQATVEAFFEHMIASESKARAASLSKHASALPEPTLEPAPM